MANKTKKSVAAQLPPITDAAAAFAKIEKEAATLSPDQIVRINVDIPMAASVVIGAAPHIVALRPQVVAELPKFPVRSIDDLRTYALAALYAHLLAMPAAGSDSEIKKLNEEAVPLRESLLVAAEALAHRGLFDKDRAAEIRSGKGYVDTASDLIALSAEFRMLWDQIKNKTAVELSEVERAAELGPEMLVALGAKVQPGIVTPEATDPAERRIRAYSLMARAYDQCRRALTYLRWDEDDVSLIAPPLQTGRGRKAAKEEPVEEGQPAEAGAAPQPVEPKLADKSANGKPVEVKPVDKPAAERPERVIN